GRPASWLRELAESSEFREPATLEPAVFPADPTAGATWSAARLEELGRLRSVVLAGLGGDARALGERLARLYEALARSGTGEGPRHLVVRGVGAPTSCLLRLTWLSLPLEDRVRVAFVTEQRRSERPRAQLLGLPEAEWGRYVPEGSWVLDEDEPFPPTAGRILWAERVASPDFPAGFRRLDARAELRGWSLVEGDDLDAEALRARWRAGWCDRGPSLDGVERLWAVESRRPGGPRSGAVGVALGRAVSPDGDEEPREGAVRRATDVVAGLPADARVPVLRGAVRTLGRGGPEGRIRGGLLRCRAAAAHPETAGELARLLDRESGALRALLSGAGGPGGIELVLGAAPGAAAGDPMARELVRLGALETRWTAADARELARRLAEVDGRRGVVRDVLEALVHDPSRHEALGTAARSLVPLLATDAVSGLARELMDGPSRETALGAAGFPVLEALAEAGRADERAGALVLALGGVRPPEAEPEPWRALVAEAPASWFSGATVLGAWVRALDAGRRPFGDGV
ncbi:MAG TPA: hypothetical protein VLL48_10460, partial [Longimicrobiales bacterium]|nr:hypothetical protein [Longimicrobiales bacterium]